jgi:GT2 family glycosyltransferase
MMLKTAVVILNWNGKKFLEHYLPSVIKHTDIEGVKVFVADNGSDDGSVEFLDEVFPGVGIIQLDRNYGFAEGYNRALSGLQAEYFLLLNSDVEVTENWLGPLIEVMDSNPTAAASMPKIISDRNRDEFEYAGAAGGFIDRYGYPFCQGRIFNCVEKDYAQYEHQRDIFWATGACMMVRAKLYDLAGGLDGDFFAHMEEIDLCWRLKNRGYRIIYQPRSKIYHYGGGTLPQGNPAKAFLNFRNNLLLLYKNLPERDLRSGILIRQFLDGIAALRFLAKGSLGEFIAVFRAHMAFYAMRNNYRQFRKEEAGSITKTKHSEILPRSIVVMYYLRGRKTFSELEW